jgi:hypothetical protein
MDIILGILGDQLLTLKGKDRGYPWHVIYRRILLARKVTHITENSTIKTVPFAEGTSIY